MTDSKVEVAFVGLGRMGVPMARNLIAGGCRVRGYDISESARDAAHQAGVDVTASLRDALAGANAMVSAVPAAAQMRALYLGEHGALRASDPGTLFIDCSTIDSSTAREVIGAASSLGHAMVDSPMSGGVAGAEAGTLTFMVGGSEEAFGRAQPLLESMGRNIFHAGGPGAGCAVKICNNLMLGITMIGVSEGFNLAEKLGLDAETLHRIASTATSRCWALTDYCPAPGPAPNAPSARGYRGGFSAELMLKDLRLAMEVAREREVATPLGAQAAQIYGLLDLAGMSDLDFSAVIRFLAGRGRPEA